MAQNYGENRFIVKHGKSRTVRIARLNINKSFTDREFGGDALACAIAYRDHVLEREKLGVLMHSQPRLISKGGACSIAGVELKIEPRSNGRGYNATFTAYFKSSDGRYKRRSFSIRKYGYAGAFELALGWRIYTSGLPIDPEGVELPRPSVRQFVILVGIGVTAPSPYVQAKA